MRSLRARPVSSHAAATVEAPPIAVSSHEPTFIGELGFTTRSMLANRSGRPRSLTRSAGLTTRPAVASSVELRASRSLPVIRAPSASVEDAPARPPVKRYQAISCSHTGGFTIGRP